MSSPIIQPILHMSTAVEYSVSPSSNSGALACERIVARYGQFRCRRDGSSKVYKSGV